MRTENPVRSFSSARFIGTFLLFAMFLSACKDEITNIIYERESLSDPSIIPTVIFTLPGNGKVGPFDDLYVPDIFQDGHDRPHFVAQFNKYIGTQTLPPNAVTIAGFDDSVVVELHQRDYYGNIPPLYSDILAFEVEGEFGRSPLYKVGQTYTVTIQTSLSDINGNHLQAPHTFSYTPEPEFRITEVYPTGGTTLGGLDLYFGIRFNTYPAADLPSYIHINPDLSGDWVWNYDSSGVSFFADGFAEFNTTYAVTIDKDAADRFGNTLQTGLDFAYQTSPFQLVYSSPMDGSIDNYLDDVELFFSGPLDTGTVRSAFGITPDIPGILFLYETHFTFQPVPRLDPNTQYTVSISSALSAWNGTSLPTPVQVTFITEPFDVDWTFPQDGYNSWPRSYAITTHFNAPIDVSTAEGAFEISPKTVGTFSYSADSLEFIFTPSSLLEPYQHYDVTVGTSLRSLAGDYLLEPVSISFSTGY